MKNLSEALQQETFYLYLIAFCRSSEGSCESSCHIEDYQSDHTVTDIGSGQNVTIEVFAYVHYPTEPRLIGLPLVIEHGTFPEPPIG